MSPTLWRWLAQAARNPAPVLVILFILIVATASLAEPLAYFLVALTFPVLGQLLRVFWRRSKVVALLLGAGLPLFNLLASPVREASMALLFVPAFLALVLERLAMRPQASWLGLDTDRPIGDGAESSLQPSTRGQGCRNSLILLGLFGAVTTVFFVWSINAPVTAARAFKERLRIGMKLSEVVVASFGAPRHFVSVNAPEGAPRLQIGGSNVLVDQERADSESHVRALLDRRGAELRVNSITFMFLSTIPVRSSIVVRFDTEGRVTAIEGPHNWAS